MEKRGVCELWGEDGVVFAETRRDGAGIRGKTGLKDDARLDVLERRDLLFEFHVQFHRAGDGANRARSRAIPFYGVQRRLAQRFVRGESEVVVRSEVDHFLAFENTHWPLLSFSNTRLRTSALA